MRVYLSLLFLAFTACLRAQGATSLRGRVIDSTSGAALSGVSITQAASDVRATSDSAGRFAIRIRPGRVVLHARRLGFLAATDTVDVDGADTTEHVVTMQPLPQELKQIVVAGRPVTFPKSFEDAYKRASKGRGFFVTREDVDQWSAKDFESIFNRIPGVSANDRGVSFQRCQVGLEYLTNRRALPKVQVYIDGSRVIIGADDTLGILAVLRSVKPHMIQIMEVYTGVAMIPAEFLADACAVVVIWTKRD